MDRRRKEQRILILQGEPGTEKTQFTMFLQLVFDYDKGTNIISLDKDPKERELILQHKAPGPVIIDEFNHEDRNQFHEMTRILRSKNYRHINFIILTQKRLPDIFYNGSLSWSINAISV